ncbi:MAG: HNH endonuclease [Chloroflexi bacterium]|nr:HNH endonuclease [Chloroflexota bacterium]
MDGSVLVLNQNYEPLNVCDARRAIVLLNRGKAELLEQGRGSLRTPSRVYTRPSVIRMIYLIKRPRPKPKLTRREIFARDNYMCQYCGIKTRELTIDHIIPRHRGGKHTWENLAAACRTCNHKKGGKTPEQAHMRLLRIPFEPKPAGFFVAYRHLQANDTWQKFLPEGHRSSESSTDA